MCGILAKEDQVERASLKFDTWMKDVAKRGQGKGHEMKWML